MLKNHYNNSDISKINSDHFKVKKKIQTHTTGKKTQKKSPAPLTKTSLAADLLTPPPATTTKKGFQKYKIFLYLLLFGMIGLAIYRLLPELKDFKKLVELKDQIHYGWMFAALFSQFFQYLGDGWLSQLLLKMVDVRMGMWDTFRIAALNVFAAHILPVGEAGGLAAAYHFYRRLGVSAENFIFLTICWGIITNGLLMLLVFVPLFILPDLPLPTSASTTLTLLVLGIIVLLFILMRKIIFAQLEKIFKKYSWSQHLLSFIKNRKKYAKLFLTRPALLYPSILASFMYYAANIVTLALSFKTFGIMPNLILVTFAYSASLIFGKITLAPAGIGATEATLILIFLTAHTDPSITLAAVLLYRLISFWLPIPGGLFSYYSLRKDINKKLLISEMTELKNK